jgi:hypothetical protein
MPVTRREVLSMAAAKAATGGVPLAAFGPHRISRLIVGGNPVSGNSHWSKTMDREMVDYFTSTNVKRMLRRCEECGINTWQSRGDRHILRLLHEYRQEGGRIHWIAQTATEIDARRNLAEIAAEKPIGIYHHGSRTDKLWAEGAIGKVEETLKAIRQTGARVGLGTHIPEVIDYAECRGWDIDFYMTCLYNLSQGENFQEPDREKMLQRVRDTQRQCLIFKVYGATRRCASRQDMRDALRQAVSAAKPDDAIVIGMYPKEKDQVAENCSLMREALAQTS